MTKVTRVKPMNLSQLKPIRTSSQKAFQRCPRFYKLGYVDRYKPIIEAHALRFGTLFHRALEIWWREWRDSTKHRLETALYYIETSDSNLIDMVKATELMRGYHYRWADDPIRTSGVEVRFEIPIINPRTGATSRTWKLTGTIDAVAKYPRSTLPWIIEHKTTSENIEPGSVYWQRLTLDTQVSNYYRALDIEGTPVAGCIYDVIRKPQIKPLLATPPEKQKYKRDGTLYANQRDKDETADEYRARLRDHIAENPNEYFQRAEIYRLANEEKDAAFDLWQTARMIRDAELADRWPRNPNMCFFWNRPCDFWPVCSGETSIENPNRYLKKEEENVIAEPSEGANPDAIPF